MRSETLRVRTGGHATVHDLTSECARFVRELGDGLLSVFVPHATAGLAILETGAGSDADLLNALDDAAASRQPVGASARQRGARA